MTLLKVPRFLRAESVTGTDDVRSLGESSEEFGEVGQDIQHLGCVAAGAKDDEEMCRIALTTTGRIPLTGRRLRTERGRLRPGPLYDPEDPHEDETAEEEDGNGEDEEDLDAAVVGFGVILLEVAGVVGDDSALGGGAEDPVHFDW